MKELSISEISFVSGGNNDISLADAAILLGIFVAPETILGTAIGGLFGAPFVGGFCGALGSIGGVATLVSLLPDVLPKKTQPEETNK